MANHFVDIVAVFIHIRGKLRTKLQSNINAFDGHITQLPVIPYQDQVVIDPIDSALLAIDLQVD